MTNGKTEKTTNRAKGNAALLLTAIVWGSGFIAQKLGMDYVGPFTFNMCRQVLGALVLLPYAIYCARRSGQAAQSAVTANESGMRKGRYDDQPDWRRVGRRDLLIGSIICGVFLSLGTNLQQIGLITVDAGKSGFITAIYIVLIPLLGAFIGNKTTPKVWLCVLLAMLGFGVMSLNGSSLGSISSGDWITLAGSLCFACQMIAIDRYVARHDAIVLSVAQMFVASFISMAGALLTETITMSGLRAGAVAILYSALVPTAIGYTLQTVGQKYTDPTIAALLLSMESVFATVFGIMLLGERPVPRELFGCLLILVAVIMAQLPGRNTANDIKSQ